MPHPLDGAKEKVKRAIKHLNEFIKEAGSFQRGAYTVLVEKDEQPDSVKLIAKDMGSGDPPIPLILIAGEVAYQLRSALDHVIYILAKETPEGSRQFPICDSPKEYESRGLSMIKGVSDSASALIDSLQPYHRGSDAHKDTLWVLKKLNNTDKHRVIPATLVYARHLRVNIGDDRLDVTILVGETEPKDGAKLCSLSPIKPNVQVKAEAFCTVAFKQIADTKYEPVVPLLTQMITYVSEIIARFSPEFLAF